MFSPELNVTNRPTHKYLVNVDISYSCQPVIDLHDILKVQMFKKKNPYVF